MKTKLNQSKLKLAIVSAMLLGTAGLTVPAYADATGTMIVSASIGLACTIETTNLAFGAYDAVVANKTLPLDSLTGSIASTCTSGSSGSIKLSDGGNAVEGNRRMVHATDATKFLNYTVSGVSLGGAKWDNTTGRTYTGTGTKETLDVYGQVAANQGSAINGSYGDSLLATITY